MFLKFRMNVFALHTIITIIVIIIIIVYVISI